MNNLKPMRVVVAEDEYLLSEDITRTLKKMGHHIVGEAVDGKEAVKIVMEKEPDIVLMDIQMPKMDGLEAARQIQSKKPTPIVVLTAHESQDLVDRASESGVSIYLTKPPQTAEIQRAMTMAVARHQDVLELRRLNNALSKEVENRIKIESFLKATLEEKDVLLREIHHRVKNNFAMISSLLNLQARQIENGKAQAAVLQSRDRIHSMALIHEKLYQSGELAKINLLEYLKSLTTEIIQSRQTLETKVAIRCQGDDIITGVEQAIHCGLIINELVTNALKYAFQNSSGLKNTIQVTLERNKADRAMLTVRDNGIGLPKNMDVLETDTLGLKLVWMLAEDQLDGMIEVFRNAGTTFQIDFRIFE